MLESITRTFVPIAAGFLITQLARLGVSIDEATTATFVTSVVAGVYYALARALEIKLPKFGWLLGSPKQPSYGE